jgi:multidrug efflux pump subunit AcrA (membrane-fusion protein)
MKRASLILFAFLTAGLIGCGEKEEKHAEGEHHDHGAEAEGARFAEGKGIALLEETRKAIGLELEEVQERKLAPAISVEAQIYRTPGEPSRAGAEKSEFAYATAFANSTAAEQLKPGDSALLKLGETEFSARVWRIDTSSAAAVGSAEAILEISDPQKVLRVGDFVSGTVTFAGGDTEVTAISRSAVLETSAGKFAFVQNGDFLLRTPVTTGAESAEHVEITDGLYAGDIVANKPVETLYLIELRATKGGGHSH